MLSVISLNKNIPTGFVLVKRGRVKHHNSTQLETILTMHSELSTRKNTKSIRCFAKFLQYVQKRTRT